MALNLSSLGGGLQQNQQIFTSSGTWTPPNGVTRARVRVIGGGAPSACGGGFIDRTLTVTPNVPITVTVGAPSGTSQFGSSLLATGGNSQPASALSYVESGVGEEIGVSRGGLATLMRAIPVPSFPTSSSTSFPTYPNYSASPVPIGGVYCILDPNGTTTYTSTDGINWTTNASALPVACSTMSYAGSYFIAVTTASSSTAYYSANGVSWTAVTMPSAGVWKLIGSNGTALAYISGTTTAATVSSNTNWVAQSLPAIPASLPYQAGSNFYFYSATTVYYSSTGATASWSAATGVTTMSSVWYLNGYYVLLAAPLAAGTVATYYSAAGIVFTAGTVLSAGTASTPTVYAGVAGTTLFVGVVVSNALYGVYSSSAYNSWTSNGIINQWWGPNFVYSSAYGMYDQFILNLALPNNRYFSIVAYPFSSGILARATPILFSDGFVSGNVGLNTPVGLYPGGVLSGTSNATQPAPFINNGTPEGYAVGYYSAYPNPSPSFGCGGQGIGGQGAVIVDWLA